MCSRWSEGSVCSGSRHLLICPNKPAPFQPPYQRRQQQPQIPKIDGDVFPIIGRPSSKLRASSSEQLFGSVLGKRRCDRQPFLRAPGSLLIDSEGVTSLAKYRDPRTSVRPPRNDQSAFEALLPLSSRFWSRVCGAAPCVEALPSAATRFGRVHWCRHA